MTDSANTDSKSQPSQAKSLLKNAFSEAENSSYKHSYTHPHSESLFDTAYEVLERSETGKHLLAVAESKGIQISFLKGPQVKRFVPSIYDAHLTVPASRAASGPREILEMGAMLREIEQELLGFSLPDPKEDPLDYVAISHAKNLDSIVHMCKIAYELNKNISLKEFLDELAKMGHGDIYQAFLDEQRA